MDKTLEHLPNEDKICVVVQKQQRQECELCGKGAHYKHTWLLTGTRSNFASRAYGRDDCSWCEDACTYACPDCTNKMRPPDGYVSNSVFPASGRFAHMFLTKTSIEISPEMADAFDKLLSALV